MNWRDVPHDTRLKILEKYKANPSQQAIEDAAAILGMKANTLLRRLQEMVQNKSIQHTTKPKPNLTDLYWISEDTDQGKWLEALYNYAETQRWVSVMHLCDIHVPYHYQPAVDLAI
ncbi:MAG: hypothetical protein CUN52_15540, partial [Phototrophicales bacterium]